MTYHDISLYNIIFLLQKFIEKYNNRIQICLTGLLSKYIPPNLSYIILDYTCLISEAETS